MHIAMYPLAEFGPDPRGRSSERKPWVAQLVGLDPKRLFDRRFLDGSRDYAGADKKGRGTKLYFKLEYGKLYEVNRWKTRYAEDRYFVRVDNDGDVVGVAQALVMKVLEEATCQRDETIRRSLAALDSQPVANSAST